MKLRDIFNTVSEMMGDLSVPSWARKDNARDFLRDLGFKMLGAGVTSVAYSHENWGGIALKVSGWGVDMPPDLDKVPELRKYWLKPLFRSAHVVIQPLAGKLLDAGRWARTLDDEFRTHCLDIHDENIGLWRGRVVIFDC